VRIGIRTASSGRLAAPTAVRAVASAAEQVGYATVWAVDQPAEVLAFSAAVTSRLRLGAVVSAAGPAHAGRLAHSLGAVDRLSTGRLAVALDADDAGLDEVDRAWPGGRRAPVLLTGADPAALERVARRSDGWLAVGVRVTSLVPLWRGVREAAAHHGRDPDGLELVVWADVASGDDVARVVADLLFARAAGASEAVLGLGGDPTVDEALDCYARIAEAVDLEPASA
jgi:alkanesulfonate monooxygenase SsuD/methylene tetrahydromethanopterin reductase-like flavin-dependent oxidoreductase (luciferase family)